MRARAHIRSTPRICDLMQLENEVFDMHCTLNVFYIALGFATKGHLGMLITNCNATFANYSISLEMCMMFVPRKIAYCYNLV